LATCKYCQIPLKWKQPYTAGDRPVELNDQPHNCPNFSGKKDYTSKKQWSKPLEPNDLEFCDMCDRWMVTEETHNRRPELHYISKEDHIKMFHPNGEILDDIDFMSPAVSDGETSEDAKNRIRKEWNQPKPTTKYLLVGKRVS
jgi:hypothetical protein